MLPRSNNEDISKRREDPKSNTKHSVLNVNATEFVPSNAAQWPNGANSEPIPAELMIPMAVQIQNSEVRRSETIDDSAAYAQSLFAHPNYVAVDQTNNYYIGCGAENNGGPPLLAQGYTPLCCLSEEHLQDEAACLSGPQYAHSPYSLLGPMRNIQYTGCDANMSAMSPQRTVYTHSPNPTIRQMQNFDGRCCTMNFDKASYLQRHHYPPNEVYPPVNPMQFYNGGYQTKENGVPVYQWRDLAPIPPIPPIPHTNDFLSSNQEFTYPRYPASDRTMSPGIDWDYQPEYNKKIATNETASRLPEGNSSILGKNLSSDNLMDAAWSASFQQNAVSIEATADTKITPVDGLMNNETENSSVESAATPGNNACEEAQPVKNPKPNRKKRRSRNAKVVCSDKEHVNIVFIGHVDAGKSTLGGQLMYMTGTVDKRIIERFELDAKQQSRETWYLSWTLDTNQEERDRGKTVETGRGYFETETRHFTILDAPGHTCFVPSMISGAAQADIAVLVLSARLNEFETGFDKGGQTRDHAMLAKSAGVNVLIALVNKMDDPSVNWDQKRFDYCRANTLPFLKKLGYTSRDVYFLPVSALTGHGLMTAVPKSICPWFEGPSFIECLEQLAPFRRRFESPFVMPIAEKFKDMGTVVMGKIESGSTHASSSLLLLPIKVNVTIDKIWLGDRSVNMVKAGENIKMRLKGIEEEDVTEGFVLCDINKPISIAKMFDAQLHIFNCKSIITPGFQAVMHIQSVVEEITITHLFCLIDPKTRAKTKKYDLQFVKRNEDAIMRIKCSGVVCLTEFKEFQPLGRFTLRYESKVIAIGKVLKIIE